MLDFVSNVDVYIVCGYTDLRKSIDGYGSIIQDKFNVDPFQKALFLFCNKHRDKLKILFWDRDGFWLLYKRLESSKFNWPKNKSELKMITLKQLEWLLDGLSIEQKNYHETVKKKYF